MSLSFLQDVCLYSKIDWKLLILEDNKVASEQTSNENMLLSKVGIY